MSINERVNMYWGTCKFKKIIRNVFSSEKRTPLGWAIWLMLDCVGLISVSGCSLCSHYCLKVTEVVQHRHRFVNLEPLIFTLLLHTELLFLTICPVDHQQSQVHHPDLRQYVPTVFSVIPLAAANAWLSRTPLKDLT